jgi:hypothetical protein
VGATEAAPPGTPGAEAAAAAVDAAVAEQQAAVQLQRRVQALLWLGDYVRLHAEYQAWRAEAAAAGGGAADGQRLLKQVGRAGSARAGAGGFDRDLIPLTRMCLESPPPPPRPPARR